jgi:hypothetical protein
LTRAPGLWQRESQKEEDVTPIELITRYWDGRITVAQKNNRDVLPVLREIGAEWHHIAALLPGAPLAAGPFAAWLSVPVKASAWLLSEETHRRRKHIRDVSLEAMAKLLTPAEQHALTSPQFSPMDHASGERLDEMRRVAAVALVPLAQLISGDPAVPGLGRLIAIEAAELWTRAWL